MNEERMERERNKTLLIVEGKKEEELLRRIFLFFPELTVFPADILIHQANIYDLERIIQEEYGKNWDEEEIDLPFLVGRKKGQRLNLRDFSNVFLIFDFDPQDTFFSAGTIRRMCKHFCDAAYEGMLYINYPMVESYLHFSSLPDEAFFTRSVSLDVLKRTGANESYKSIVQRESAIAADLDMTENVQKQTDQLLGKSSKCAESLFQRIITTDVSAYTDKNTVADLLSQWNPQLDLKRDKTKNTRRFALADSMCKAAMLSYEGKTVSQRLQTILRLIMQHCLKKALMLQGDELALWDTEKNTAIKNAEVLYERVLEAQLSYLSEEKTMQVLNTAVLLVFEYKKALLFDND